MEADKTFSYAEIILLVMFGIIIDIISIIPIVNIVSAFVSFAVTNLYFLFKGVKATFNMVAGAFELIPILPAATVGIVVTILVTNNPTLRKKIQKATAIVKPAQGKN